jgi:hypothetical protein
MSDIAGNDIRGHDYQPNKVIRAIFDWLETNGFQPIFSKSDITDAFSEFEVSFADFMNEKKEDANDMDAITFSRLIQMMGNWIHTYKESDLKASNK